MTDVVVVESPAKAKTINKYLGGGYTVLASFGHVRDLPPKDGSVRPEEGFAMDWAADDRGDRQVSAIAKALKGADTLYLATDPDREGEAISWHVRAMLEEKRALRGIEVHRITFNEITKSAVQYAIAHPRELDQPLIEAYLARRALDYLVGFTLSPVLWRKLPGSKSAGRVQSVALRIICEREAEIEVFKPREYWTVEAHFRTPAGAPFTARLTHLDGKRLDGDHLALRPGVAAPIGVGRHVLAEHGDPRRADPFDRADDFARHGDHPRREAVAARHRRRAHDMADPEIGRRARPAVDDHRHIRRIGDAQIVDDDAAELSDRPDDAGAADAAVGRAAGRRLGRARAADAAIVGAGSGGATARPQKGKPGDAAEQAAPRHVTRLQDSVSDPSAAGASFISSR